MHSEPTECTDSPGYLSWNGFGRRAVGKPQMWTLSELPNLLSQAWRPGAAEAIALSSTITEGGWVTGVSDCGAGCPPHSDHLGRWALVRAGLARFQAGCHSSRPNGRETWPVWPWSDRKMQPE